jgi:O-glycosyl hydrolase
MTLWCASWLSVVLCSAAHAEPAVVVLEPSVTYQTLIGYGQGNMDQANPGWYTELSVEGREELLDRLYTLKGDGLGLTICRTYLCAGDAPGHAHWGRRAGGSVSPPAFAPEPGKWEWEGREASLWHPQGAAKRGATMVAFVNSPPWWMTVSGCTSGSAGGSSNLRAGMEDEFVSYICEILKHYRDAWGIDFDRVSPINEPEANWWKEGEGQDGCHVDAEQAALIFALLDKQLRERGLRARVQGFEAAFAQSLGYLDQVLGDGEAFQALADLTCHQYQTDFHSLRRWPLRARLHGKPLWMSEWGDWTNRGMDQALNYARKLHEAHRLMQAEAWCMWEPSLIFDRQGERLQPRPAYYAIAQFSRFARPGMQVIDTSDVTLKTTAYVDAKARTLAIVTTNDTDQPVELAYDLSGFEGVAGIEARRTSETETLAALDALPGGGSLTATLPARSVTTFRTTYSAVRAPLIANGCFETGRLDPWVGSPADLTGVQDNYPHGGSFDGYVDLKPGATGSLSQRVSGLIPGARYVLTAACATSGIPARLLIEGQGMSAATSVSGGSYQHARLDFTAPADGVVTVTYAAGPDPGEHPWATIDSVRLSPQRP